MSFYSERSESVFTEILKLHPKFKPKYFERSHHIFCFKFPQPQFQEIPAEDLKPIANELSKRFDIPVSIYCDKYTFSIAIFWDARVLGSFKILDYETHLASKKIGLDQFVKLTLETNFSMEELLNKETHDPLPTLPVALLRGTRIRAQS